jgi:hypothetical protein
MQKLPDYNKHFRILGILFIAFSALNLAFMAMGVFLFAEFLPFYVQEEEALFVFTVIKYVIYTFAFVFTVPSFIAGIGLLYHKPWALTLAFIIGIMALPAFPIWTGIGIYAIIIFIMYQRDH